MPSILYVAQTPILYVAGPMTTGGDPYRNIGLGYAAAHLARKRGWAPYVPQSDALWNAMVGFAGDLPVSYEEWLAHDFVFVRAAFALLRLPGVSQGADREEALARSLGKPVYLGEDELPEVVVRVRALRSVDDPACRPCPLCNQPHCFCE